MTAKGDKTLAVSHRFKELREESRENITTDFGKQLKMNRSIQLLGLAYNIKKLSGDRLGVSLFELKTA